MLSLKLNYSKLIKKTQHCSSSNIYCIIVIVAIMIVILVYRILLQFHLPYPQNSRIFDTHVMSVRQYLGQLKVESYLKIRNTLQNDVKPLKVKFYYWWAFVEVALLLQVTYESWGNWKVLTSDRL